MKPKKLLLSLALLCAFQPRAMAQSFLELASLNPATQYQHFETEHFEFDFQEGYFNFTKEAAKHLEHAHQIMSPILQWQPRTKIHVLVADNEDNANGFAMPSLRVGMVLIATPPDQAFSTSYTENWIKLLVFHEYAHILNIDPTTGWMEFLRVVFGDAIRPNGLWPRWALEGLAVYYETRTSILGRGRSPYYDAIVRSYFNEDKIGNHRKGSIHYGTLSGEWPYFPGGEVPYLFGYHLWNQFAKDTQNDLKMGEYSINSSHRVPFFIDGNLENTIGKTWQILWNEFIETSRSRYESQIDQVKAAGETSYQFVTDSKYSATGGTISPDGLWLAYTEVRQDERSGLILQNLKTGKKKKIDDKLQGVSMSFTPDSKHLIFSALHRNTTFTLFSDLFSYDLDSKKFHQITDGMRAKDPNLSLDGSKITFTVTDHATHLLKVADLAWSKGKPVLENIRTWHQPAEFSIIGTPKWSSPTDVVFSIQNLNESEAKLMKISLNQSNPSVLVSNGKINRFPTVCNGKLLHVSDQTGIDNVYDGNTLLTNVITAVQFPFCSPDGSLYGSVLTSDGFEIAQFALADHQPTNQKNQLIKPDAPESINEAIHSPELKIDESQVTHYSPLRTMGPRQWAPFGYFASNAVTGSTAGGILLGFDSSGTFDGTLDYTYYGFRPALDFGVASYSTDIGADAAGKKFKRTYEAGVSLSHLTQWTWSSLRLAPYVSVDWNELQSVDTHQKLSSSDLEFQKPFVPVAGMKTTFSDVRNSRLGFMPEGGSTFTTQTQARIYQDEFTLWKFMTEYSRFISPGSHHVLNPKFRYLGSSHPYGQERSYSLLKGKSTDNLFDRGRGFSLSQMQIRGYPNMNILTKSSLQAALDYHFPIDTFFSGSGPTFLKQAHGFVFGETTYIPKKGKHLPSFGLGITADATLLWNVPFSISAEMQFGTNKQFGGDQLFFISFETASL